MNTQILHMKSLEILHSLPSVTTGKTTFLVEVEYIELYLPFYLLFNFFFFILLMIVSYFNSKSLYIFNRMGEDC